MASRGSPEWPPEDLLLTTSRVGAEQVGANRLQAAARLWSARLAATASAADGGGGGGVFGGGGGSGGSLLGGRVSEANMSELKQQAQASAQAAREQVRAAASCRWLPSALPREPLRSTRGAPDLP